MVFIFTFQDKAKKSWFDRNAESIELEVEDNDSEEERVNNCKQKKASSSHLKKLQQVYSNCSHFFFSVASPHQGSIRHLGNFSSFKLLSLLKYSIYSRLQELNMLLSRPLQPKTFSHRFLAGVIFLHLFCISFSFILVHIDDLPLSLMMTFLIFYFLYHLKMLKHLFYESEHT